MNGLFPLYETTVTPGAQLVLARTGKTAGEFIGCHVAGDFGEIDVGSAPENYLSIERDEQVYSAYLLPDLETVLWITTDLADDGKWTLVCLPEEYPDGYDGL